MRKLSMARKKMKQTAKTKTKTKNTKRKVRFLASTVIESLEKSFKAMPAQIATQCRKELAKLKPQEKKLMNDLKKAQAQNKFIKDKQASLAAKSTATAKKQLAATKKSLATSNTVVSTLLEECEQVKKMSRSIAQKQEKFIALGKELAKIEKQLDMKMNKTVIKKPKKPVQKTIAKPIIEESTAQPQEAFHAVTTNEAVEYNS